MRHFVWESPTTASAPGLCEHASRGYPQALRVPWRLPLARAPCEVTCEASDGGAFPSLDVNKGDRLRARLSTSDDLSSTPSRSIDPAPSISGGMVVQRWERWECERKPHPSTFCRQPSKRTSLNAIMKARSYLVTSSWLLSSRAPEAACKEQAVGEKVGPTRSAGGVLLSLLTFGRAPIAKLAMPMPPPGLKAMPVAPPGRSETPGSPAVIAVDSERQRRVWSIADQSAPPAAALVLVGGALLFPAWEGAAVRGISRSNFATHEYPDLPAARRPW